MKTLPVSLRKNVSRGDWPWSTRHNRMEPQSVWIARWWKWQGACYYSQNCPRHFGLRYLLPRAISETNVQRVFWEGKSHMNSGLVWLQINVTSELSDARCTCWTKYEREYSSGIWDLSRNIEYGNPRAENSHCSWCKISWVVDDTWSEIETGRWRYMEWNRGGRGTVANQRRYR